MPAGELAGDVDRVGAAGVEQHLRALDRRDLGELLAEGERLVVRVAREHVVGLEPLHLLKRGLRELGVRVADVRVPRACGAIEETAPVLGEDVGALAAIDHELAAEDRRQMRLRGPERGTVEDRALSTRLMPASRDSITQRTCRSCSKSAPARGSGR